jgi:hypothetical protein
MVVPVPTPPSQRAGLPIDGGGGRPRRRRAPASAPRPGRPRDLATNVQANSAGTTRLDGPLASDASNRVPDVLSDDPGAGTKVPFRCRVETILVDSVRRTQIAFLNGPLFLPRIGSSIELGPPLRLATVRSTQMSLPARRTLETVEQAVAVLVVDLDDPGPPST